MGKCPLRSIDPNNNEVGNSALDIVALVTLILNVPGIIAAVVGAFVGYQSYKQLQKMGEVRSHTRDCPFLTTENIAGEPLLLPLHRKPSAESIAQKSGFHGCIIQVQSHIKKKRKREAAMGLSQMAMP